MVLVRHSPYFRAELLRIPVPSLGHWICRKGANIGRSRHLSVSREAPALTICGVERTRLDACRQMRRNVFFHEGTTYDPRCRETCFDGAETGGQIVRRSNLVRKKSDSDAGFEPATRFKESLSAASAGSCTILREAARAVRQELCKIRSNGTMRCGSSSP